MYGWFKPLKGAAHEYQILGFDVEGSGSGDGFICGAIVGEFVSEFHTSRSQMWAALRHYGAQGFLLYSHNLQYDLPILEGDDFPSGSLTFTRFNLLWGKYKYHGKQARFYDSANLFPRHSLEAIGSLVNFAKLPLDPLLLSSMAQGARWISFTPAQQETVRKYVERDAEIVFRAVSMMQELALDLGGQLRPTISGVAMDIYRRHYHKWPWKVLGPKTNKFVRSGYYGGRVENFAVGQVEGVNMYDVTSLYPSAQRSTSFPHPNKIKLELFPKLTGPWLEWEGIASVTIEVPESFMPPLPYRHTKRLFFPYGKLKGEWAICEIRRAQRAGAKLQAVHWVLGSDVTFNPFVDFIDGIFSLREFYLAEDKGAANLLKLILNSLYGRWGVNPESGLYSLTNMELIEDFDKLKGHTTQEINGVLFSYGPIEGIRHPDYMNVFLAAQISAQGREILFDELERQGEQAVYCDTDSIITYGEIETGPSLGDWRLQMEGGSADLIGPKEYALHNQYSGSVYKAKGIPPRLAQEYFQTGSTRFFRALPIREALAKGQRPSTWVETFRTSNVVIPKRWALDDFAYEDLGCCQTFPYQRQELAGLVLAEAPQPEIEPLSLDRVRPAGPQPSQLRLLE